jgi:CheY-like chemotaxis protein
MKVLVVEDDDLLRKSYERILQGRHEFMLAADPREARLVLQDGFKPDVILSDWNMPVMNGGEFCEILRELGINIPFIIISAEDRTAMVEKIGANEALLKPFTPSVILLAVEKWGNYNVADQKEE